MSPLNESGPNLLQATVRLTLDVAVNFPVSVAPVNSSDKAMDNGLPLCLVCG